MLRSLTHLPHIVQSIELNATFKRFPACPKPFFNVSTLAQDEGALFSEDCIPQWLRAEYRADMRPEEVRRVAKRALSPPQSTGDNNAPLAA